MGGGGALCAGGPGGQGGDGDSWAMVRGWNAELMIGIGKWGPYQRQALGERGNKGMGESKDRGSENMGTYRMTRHLLFETKEEAQKHFHESVAEDNDRGRWARLGRQRGGPKAQKGGQQGW